MPIYAMGQIWQSYFIWGTKRAMENGMENNFRCSNDRSITVYDQPIVGEPMKLRGGRKTGVIEDQNMATATGTDKFDKEDLRCKKNGISSPGDMNLNHNGLMLLVTYVGMSNVAQHNAVGVGIFVIKDSYPDGPEHSQKWRMSTSTKISVRLRAVQFGRGLSAREMKIDVVQPAVLASPKEPGSTARSSKPEGIFGAERKYELDNTTRRGVTSRIPGRPFRSTRGILRCKWILYLDTPRTQPRSFIGVLAFWIYRIGQANDLMEVFSGYFVRP
ncbi:hypothetical protein ARMGADRAFT_1029934 [Armillaria gallica]|uniref:Uncharacterized protein n=1 Tax=Armillaria gallica TaxID=47427 RepID=A0A2H3DJ56_ARMGA|nr:hypothetical protein ARMGADRAFT_1029934 [Armillaria gallica]